MMKNTHFLVGEISSALEKGLPSDMCDVSGRWKDDSDLLCNVVKKFQLSSVLTAVSDRAARAARHQLDLINILTLCYPLAQKLSVSSSFEWGEVLMWKKARGYIIQFWCSISDKLWAQYVVESKKTKEEIIKSLTTRTRRLSQQVIFNPIGKFPKFFFESISETKRKLWRIPLTFQINVDIPLPSEIISSLWQFFPFLCNHPTVERFT